MSEASPKTVSLISVPRTLRTTVYLGAGADGPAVGDVADGVLSAGALCADRGALEIGTFLPRRAV